MLSNLPPPQPVVKGKRVTAEKALRVIRDGDTIATGGFVGTGFPEKIAIALESGTSTPALRKSGRCHEGLHKGVLK